jgi:hypothetical protein
LFHNQIFSIYIELRIFLFFIYFFIRKIIFLNEKNQFLNKKSLEILFFFFFFLKIQYLFCYNLLLHELLFYLYGVKIEYQTRWNEKDSF